MLGPPFFRRALCALELTPPEDVRGHPGARPYHGRGQAEGWRFRWRPAWRCRLRCATSSGTAARPGHTSARLAAARRQFGAMGAQRRAVAQHHAHGGRGPPASHAGQGWELLTDAVIRHVAQGPRPVVFMLWGAHARQARRHSAGPRSPGAVRQPPSPLSALRPPVPFIGCGHFGQARTFPVATRGRPVVSFLRAGTVLGADSSGDDMDPLLSRLPIRWPVPGRSKI